MYPNLMVLVSTGTVYQQIKLQTVYATQLPGNFKP